MTHTHGASAPLPLFVDSLTTTVRLPGGAVKDGKVFRDITVSALTVGDQRLLFNGAGKTGWAQQRNLLAAKIMSVHGLSDSDKAWFVDNILPADVTAILLGMREISDPGHDFKFKVKCSNCRASLDVEIGHDEVFVDRALSDEERLRGTFEVSLPEYAAVFTLRHLPTSDLSVLERSTEGKTQADVAITLVCKMCSSYTVSGGEPQILTPADLKRMPMSVVSALQAAMLDRELGAKLTHSVDCTECGHTNTVRADVTDFVTRSPEKS